MCFSASVSFVAGTSLLAAGAVTVRKARHKDELPFAAIPLLFGVQQLVEGVIWFFSIWCFFAAILSGIVFLHFTAGLSSSKEGAGGMAL